jgi:protein TonB
MTWCRTSRGYLTHLILAFVTLGSLALPAAVGAQTASPTELQLLSRIAQQPEQLGNYLDLAKLYDQQRRYQEAAAMLTRAIAIVRSEQGAIAFGKPVPPQADDRPLRGGIVAPRRVTSVMPVYPEIARTAGVSGVVIVELRVGKDGSVRDARILRSVPLLDEAALDAVRQWRYVPTLLNGVPTEVVFTATVTFTRDGQASGSADAAAPGQPIRVGGDIKEPIRLKTVAPVYPDVARAAGISGVVIIEAVIDPQGRVSDARVLRSIPLLDEAALDAVRQWTFTPTLLNGVPVSVVMTVTVSFVSR